MMKFSAKLEIIGINPFVFVPEQILKQLFKEANRDKGHIPVCGTINENEYTQTLVRYSGDWRLYVNNLMLANSPKRIGESIEVTIQFDPADRILQPHPKLIAALNENEAAKMVFDNLRPSTQKEIVRYISHLKSEKSVTSNIDKAIGFLLGSNSFIGRDKP